MAATVAQWVGQPGDMLATSSRDAVADTRLGSCAPWQSLGTALAIGYLVGRRGAGALTLTRYPICPRPYGAVDGSCVMASASANTSSGIWITWLMAKAATERARVTPFKAR